MNHGTHNYVHIKVRALTGFSHLAGKAAALRDLPKFLSTLEGAPAGSTIVLDWRDIEIVSSSYWAGTLIAMLRMAQTGHVDVYFVLVNVAKACLEDLRLVLELQRQAVLVGEWNSKSRSPQRVHVLGELDAVHEETFSLLKELGSVTPAALSRRVTETGSKVGQTAWNNRLTALYNFRLARREKVGRELLYSLAVWKEWYMGLEWNRKCDEKFRHRLQLDAGTLKPPPLFKQDEALDILFPCYWIDAASLRQVGSPVTIFYRGVRAKLAIVHELTTIGEIRGEAAADLKRIFKDHPQLKDVLSATIAKVGSLDEPFYVRPHRLPKVSANWKAS
jgi:hypothetical protein